MVWTLTTENPKEVGEFVERHGCDRGVWVILHSCSMVDAINIALPENGKKEHLEVQKISAGERPVVAIHILDDRALFRGNVLVVRNPIGVYDGALMKLMISNQRSVSEPMKGMDSIRSISGEAIRRWVSIGEFIVV